MNPTVDRNTPISRPFARLVGDILGAMTYPQTPSRALRTLFPSSTIGRASVNSVRSLSDHAVLEVTAGGSRSEVHVGDTVELAVLVDGVRNAVRAAVIEVEGRRSTLLADGDPAMIEASFDGVACGFEVVADRPWPKTTPPAATVLVSDDAGLPVAVALAAEFAQSPSAALGALVWIHAGDGSAAKSFAGLAEAIEAGIIRLQVGKARRGSAVNARTLALRCPDWAERTAVVVGSAPTTAAAIELWEARGNLDSIYVQTAVARVALPVPGETPATVAVTASSDGGQFQVQSAEVLLDSLEAQGLDLESGCRRGVCHTCSVTLEAGCVTNAVDGTVSADGTRVRLCVSRPSSDLTLGI